MKFTHYHSFLNIDGKHYLFNTINSALIELNTDNYHKLQYFSTNKNDIDFDENDLKILKENGFLVDDSYDEILWARNKYLMSKYRIGNKLKIDIATTNKCNFSCTYCYERDSNKGSQITPMKKENFAKELKNYITYMLENYSIKVLQIVWFGGEPLLEFPLITSINKDLIKLASNFNIEYSNIIVTNGYLINEKVAKNLSDQNVRHVQITLDGTESFHNEKRKLINGGKTYSKILDGISYLLSNKIKVLVRINVDRSNKESIFSLIDDLYRKYKEYVLAKKLFLNIARIFGYEKSLSISEFDPVYNELWIKAAQYGFFEPSLETAREGVFCNAERDTIDSLVIDIFGKVYKCWNYVFINDANYSTLKEMSENNFTMISRNKERLKYVEKVSLLNINGGNCLSCNYLPYCQGLCPDLRLRILEGKEENIYERNKCKLIVENHIKSTIKTILWLQKMRGY